MWEKFRASKLEKYRSSPIDHEIKPFLDEINSVEHFVTLSSCSGRIAVMDMPRFGEKAQSVFLGKWHTPPAFEDVLKAIMKGKLTTWLMMHPPIIHVACESREFAEEFLKIAKLSGFRRSGVISMRRWIVEVAAPERLEMVVAARGKVFDVETIRVNYELAVEKLNKSRERMEQFRRKFREAFL